MSRVRLAASSVSLFFFLATVFAQPPAYDILIRGALVIDGSGARPRTADIAVSGDTIALVGDAADASARLVIDARGLAAAPGFNDIHTHADRGILERPQAENYVRQGVTTLISGQDGGSPLPLGPFLERVSSTPTAVNFGMLAGQGSVRRAVIGLVNRRATAAEIQKMKALVRQAMEDGAFGISTGLFYIPGSYTPTEEIVELAKVVAEYGGFHCSHMRDEAAGILDSVRECIRIGEDGGLPTQLTHHKIIGPKNWGLSVKTLELVEAARRRGVDVTIDQYPYTASSTGTRALFPQWAQEGGRDGLLERLADPTTRARIKAGIVERLKFDRGGGDPKNVVLVECEFDETLAGKNLAEVTRARGRAVTFEDAAETVIEIEEAGGCSAVYHAISEEDVRRIMRFPYTMIASDGSLPEFGKGVPHPRSYGTFPRVLGRYVREWRVLTLEDAVRKMTSLPASRLGLEDRGLLRKGMKADIVIFSPERVRDTATWLEPHQYPVGIRHVLVNGELVLRDGRMTDARPGRVLYGPGRESP
ncbi:MAG TPA: D-aminoacylase [Bryobacterales bacterium]|nr:D-aminoacylase [Bryobacterales bacterium]